MIKYIALLGVLLILVIWNSKRNMNAHNKRKNRNFKERYQQKRKKE